MSKLTSYLVRRFSRDALSLLVVAVFLVWITQALRLFDLITAKGQDLLTLVGQAALTTPPLAGAIIYLCVGIGIARALQQMQITRELHSMHAGRRHDALWRAVAVFGLAGGMAVALIVHWLEPASERLYDDWSAQVAADLVGRTLAPNRFTEITPGFVVVIGGRTEDGRITDFFADDLREPDARRTYSASSAVIVVDDAGYHLSLRDGSLQFLRVNREFSEIAFSGYELSLGRLASTTTAAEVIGQRDTTEIIATAQAQGGLSTAEWHELDRRNAETLHVFAIAAFVLAIAGFPHARRGREWVPVEVLVLVVALGDRVASEFTRFLPTGYVTSPILLMGFSLLLFTARLHSDRLPRFGRNTA